MCSLLRVSSRITHNSPLLAPIMARAVCQQCGKRCKNKHGLAIHIGRMHPDPIPVEPDPPDPEPPDDEQMNAENPETVLPHDQNSDHQCDVCGVSFPTSQGLATHSRTHPVQSNIARLNRILPQTDGGCKTRMEMTRMSLTS